MSRRAKVAAALVLVLLLTGLALILFRQFPPPAPEESPVQIGALLALTGSGANYGQSLRQGIDLAVNDINSEGGVGGRQLEVIYEDSKSDARTGVAAFNKLATVDDVPAIIGSISSVVLAVAPLADQYGVVLVNSSAISPRICEQATDFLFSVMVSGAAEAQFMAQEYGRNHPDAPLAVLYSNNASGIDTKDRFLEELASLGIHPTVVEGYELGSTDFRTQIAKIKASGARAGYLIAFSSREFARILTQSRELDLNLQWYSYSGFETKETLELAREAAQGIIYSYPEYTERRDRVEAFQQKYEDTYGSWPDIYTVTSFDAVKFLAEVIDTHGFSPQEIRDGLRATDSYAGFFGDMTFGETQCVQRDLLWKTVLGSRYVLLAGNDEASP